MTDSELEAFTRINLADYLQQREGWLKDKAESTKQSVKLRRGSDVLIVNERPGGVWLYFNPQEPSDKGNIIHYLQARRGAGFTIGHVRKELRGIPVPIASASSWEGIPREATPDLARLRWESSAPVRDLPPYLAARGLTVETVVAYASAMRLDRTGAVLFGHTDAAGRIMGYEIRSDSFKGFAKGGLRYLCRLGPIDPVEPDKIALCESAIDALSLAQMVKMRNVLFASTGGVVGSHAINEIKQLAERHPSAEILLGFDDDKGGATYSAAVADALEPNRPTRRLLPSCKDWNDVLQRRSDITAIPSFNP